MNSILAKLRAWFLAEEAKAVAFLRPILTAFVANIEAVGIKDVEAFLGSVAMIVAELAADYAGGQKSGAELRSMAIDAAKVSAARLGANLEHDAIAAVLNTAVELAHQSSVAVRDATLPPDSAHTIGSTP